MDSFIRHKIKGYLSVIEKAESNIILFLFIKKARTEND